MAVLGLNSGRPAPVYRKTKNSSAWYEALVSQMISGGLAFDADAEAVPPQGGGPLPETLDPLDRFLSGIATGRVEGSRRYCPHATRWADLVLVRNSTHWLLGDAACVTGVLAQSGQDTRCDSCGDSRPDATPVTTFEIGRLKVICQLCSACTRGLGI